MYSARLKLPPSLSRSQQASLVEDALTILQLRPVQHSIVGSVERRGVSGGQRKRVNIGVELVGKPSVLFLDEPTSGLDANACVSVVW